MPNLLDAYLSQTQQRTLSALLDRVIPADDYPSATENGVLDYLSRQFVGDLAPLLPVYRVGLECLESETLAVAGKSFDALGERDQDALLARIEKSDPATQWATPPRSFFAMVVEHAAEGYYADPGNGGNRDKASWSMVGFIARESGVVR